MDYIRLLEYRTNTVENLRQFISDNSFTKLVEREP